MVKKEFFPLEMKAEACTIRLHTTSVHFCFAILSASIEPERDFSSAGILCFKLRSRMSDAVLDNMLFFRRYFTKTSASPLEQNGSI
jgi:hypothetical protein